MSEDSSWTPPSDSGTDNSAPFNVANANVAGCGSSPEFGASEICNDQRFWIRKSLAEADDASTVHPEPFTGADWWSSPDVGFVPAGRVVPGITTPLALWNAEPDWHQSSRGGSFIIRAGFQSGFYLCGYPPPTTRIQVWAAPAGTAPVFPRDYAKVADENVRLCNSCDEIKWCLFGGSCWIQCQGFACCDGQPGWHLVNDQVDGETYTFALDAPPDYMPGDGSLRAIVSRQDDPTPSPFTSPTNSNNVAQMNDLTSPVPLRYYAVDFDVERALPADSASDAAPATTTISATDFAGRPAWLYIPPANSAVWRDIGGNTFPPNDPNVPPSALVSLPVGGPAGTATVTLPPTGVKTLQVLVDASNSPANSGDHVDVTETEDGETKGGLSVNLLQQGTVLDESFEYGIPATWTATGLWHAVDQYGDPCGAADSGRRSAAFTYLDEASQFNTCDYGCSQLSQNYVVDGELDSPQVTLGQNATLSFSQFSRTGNSGDTLTVALMGGSTDTLGTVSGSGADQGGFDDWVTTSYDLSNYAGKTVQVAFRFHSPDCRGNWGYLNQGWWIDDVVIASP